MKKLIFTLAAVAMLATSCGTMGPTGMGGFGTTSATSSNTQAAATGVQSQDALGSLLSTLIGNAVPMTKQTIIGTWVYESPECRFESENYLAQAGGEVGAAAVESKLASAYAMLGIVPGQCAFAFAEDGTCTIQLGSMPLGGTYTLDTKTRELNIVIANGLARLNGKVYYNLNSLSILFDAKKLLSVAQAIATFTGRGNQAMSTVSSLMSNYNGMQIGMNLKKQ